MMEKWWGRKGHLSMATEQMTQDLRMIKLRHLRHENQKILLSAPKNIYLKTYWVCLGRFRAVLLLLYSVSNTFPLCVGAAWSSCKIIPHNWYSLVCQSTLVQRYFGLHYGFCSYYGRSINRRFDSLWPEWWRWLNILFESSFPSTWTCTANIWSRNNASSLPFFCVFQ